MRFKINNFRFQVGALAIVFYLAFGIWFASWRMTFAGTSNIVNTQQWAWNDVISWFDFRITGDPNVNVFSDRIDGYGKSGAIGYVQLNCNTPVPSGIANCVTAGNWKVANDGSGNLSGWAWSEHIGWISFWCGNVIASDCSTSNYRVIVDANGEFRGWAWNDIIGWISFNCDHTLDVPSTNPPWNTNTCATVDYRVKTVAGTSDNVKDASLISPVFDFSTVSGGDGVTINSFIWKGLPLPAGAAVKFQFASSTNNTAAEWSSAVFQGSDGTNSTYYQNDKDLLTEIKRFHDTLYFRYKITISTDTWGTSPRVDDVIINYSP